MKRDMRRGRPALAGLLLVLLGLSLLAGCARAEAPVQSVTRLPKVGKLTTGPVLIKLPATAAPTVSAAESRELAAIVAAMEAVLQGRPGNFATSTAQVLDNETLAAENPNPEYGRMLSNWGRQSGYRVVFAPREANASPSLLRASVIMSRYQTAAGAQQAYRYVVQQQEQVAQRLDLSTPAGGQAPWDEAVAFYSEASQGNQTFGTFTLVFRLRSLIGFVSNSGLSDTVTPRDTADLTQMLFERLRLS